MKQHRYLAGMVAVAAFVSPTLAADLIDAQSANPWEFYIGAHGGGVFGDGDYQFGGTSLDLDGDRAIFGALVGLNYRMDTVFFGVEGDVGFATGSFDFDFFGTNRDGCGNGAWCDFNGHIRARAGLAATEGLDLFVAGGLALADGSGGDSVFVDSNNDMFVGWSIGAGVEYAPSDAWKVRLEVLHDDYGHRDPTPSDTTNYSSNWTDNTVRAAVIFNF